MARGLIAKSNPSRGHATSASAFPACRSIHARQLLSITGHSELDGHKPEGSRIGVHVRGHSAHVIILVHSVSMPKSPELEPSLVQTVRRCLRTTKGANSQPSCNLQYGDFERARYVPET